MSLMNSIARKQRERGYSDAKVGHSPSHLRGPYMEGYVQGRSGDELNHSYRIPPDPATARIGALRDLIQHCWLHSGYQDCGYLQMTTEQKALYGEVIGRVEEEQETGEE